MAGAQNGLRQRNVNNLQVSRVVVPTAEGKKRDQELDKHTEYVLAFVHALSTQLLTPHSLGMSLVDHGVWSPS